MVVSTVILLSFSYHSEGWMALLSVSFAVCSAARPAPAASQPSLPSCPLSPHTPFFQTQRQPQLHRVPQERLVCGRGMEHQLQGVEGPGLWRGGGSFTWQNGQSFSTLRENWTQQRFFSHDPPEGTGSAACTFDVLLMQGWYFQILSFLCNVWFILKKAIVCSSSSHRSANTDTLSNCHFLTVKPVTYRKSQTKVW